MHRCEYMYSVSEIEVDEEFVKQYVYFLNRINGYLLQKYEKQYRGLQLYRIDEVKFIVVITYNNCFNINEIYEIINQYVSKEYEKRFGQFVERKVILPISDSFRVIC